MGLYGLHVGPYQQINDGRARPLLVGEGASWRQARARAPRQLGSFPTAEEAVLAFARASAAHQRRIDAASSRKRKAKPDEEQDDEDDTMARARGALETRRARAA